MFSASSREHLRGLDRWWTWKICLRLTTTVLSFMAMVCSFVAIGLYKTMDRKSYRSVKGDYGVIADSCGFIGFLWVFLFNLANFVVQLERKRPIGSGIVVAVELIAWNILVGVSTTLGLCNNAFTETLREKQWDDDDPKSIVYSERTALIIAVILGIVHFVLFVLACRETDVRNRQKKAEAEMRKIYWIVKQLQEDKATLCNRCAAPVEHQSCKTPGDAERPRLSLGPDIELGELPAKSAHPAKS